MIDRYLLRYLLAVVDKGNFSRAAAHCGVSQPTLSVGIAKLEAEVGKSLFLRTNRRVELTGAGARLVERARRIEREFTLAEHEIGSSRQQTSLRIAVISSLPSGWLGRAVARLAVEAPDERVEIVEGAERTILSLLDRGRVDVALTAVRADRARFSESFFTEDYKLVLPAEHRHADRSDIEPGELAESPMIVRRHCEGLVATSRFFTSRGVRPFISARTTSDEQAMSLVRAGHGLTVMPACFAAPGITLLGLTGFDLTRDIGFVHDRGPAERRVSPALDVVAASLRDSHRDQSSVGPGSG